jgi:hypothetical protein
MTTTDFNGVLNENGYLTAQGFGIMRFNPDEFDQERQRAYSLYDESNWCEHWLSQCTKTRGISKKIGSSIELTIKFKEWYMEDNNGKYMPIPEGALLIAAKHLGFMCERVDGTPSFYMNIANRWTVGGRWLNENVLSTAENFY